MILSIARAEVHQQDHAHVLGAWSSMVTLDPPVGLVRCWLTHAPGRIEILASWEDREAHDRVVPLARAKSARGGKTTAYVCEQGICKLPTTSVETFIEQLAK